MKFKLLESLEQEATKYGSAEEFVNSQQPVYHGTFEKFEKFDVGKLGSSTGARAQKKDSFSPPTRRWLWDMLPQKGQNLWD